MNILTVIMMIIGCALAIIGHIGFFPTNECDGETSARLCSGLILIEGFCIIICAVPLAPSLMSVLTKAFDCTP